MSQASWRLQLTRTAQRDLRRLDPPVRERVVQALRELAADPHRSGQLRRLTGVPEYRLRIGDWRALIVLDHQQHLISVTRVLPRGRAYER